MVTTLKILITMMFAWQVLKPIGSLFAIGSADWLRSKTRQPISVKDSKRMDDLATGNFIRLIWWVIMSTLMIIATWVWL